MKLKYPALMAALCASPAFATSVFINELHYDNASTDSGEFIEIIAPVGTDLTDYSVVLYNGANGSVYGTTTLSGLVADLGNGFGSYSISYPSNGIQNGAPDGVALVDASNTVVQFLSYEGTFTAVGGAADGMESTDIGVAELGADPIGGSLQLAGTGREYEDFSWELTDSNTQDGTNTNQTFTLPTPFINEIHYDNAGTDTDEFVEVAGMAGLDLSGYSIVLYNGSGGAPYSTITLSGVIADQQGGMGTLGFNKSGIQNGSPDGLALVDGEGNVIQFLSYEGAFTAVGGAADGMTSEDIGVSEASTSAVGDSLQLGGTGTAYADFSWQGSSASTFALVNNNQTFGDGGDGDGDGGTGSEGDISALFINEFHYDNISTDAGEMVEIAGPAGTDLSSVSIVLYNGGNGTAYNSYTLSGTIPDQQNGYGTVAITYPSNGIQNGSPDGIALVADGMVLEFISYEGVMTATDGPASGMTSVDVGYSENNSATPVGYSIQRVGSGHTRCAFSWSEASEATPDGVNNGQTFTVEDATNCGGNGDGGGDTVALGACYAPATLISAVQGNGSTTPMAGQAVVVEGVVTLVASNASGFYMQEEDTDSDNDPATSEGIFVYTSNLPVAAGDVVRLVGIPAEYYNKTQISDVTDYAVCGTGSVSPVAVTLPKVASDDFEAVEGMLVTNANPWVISDTYNFFKYGELVASSERLFTPTQLFAAGTDEISALIAANNLDQVIIDDSIDGTNPTLYLPAGGFGPENTIRPGTTLSDVTGVMDYSFNQYRVRVTGTPATLDTNPRTAHPVLADGNLKVASFNVLNLFNGDGNEGGFPTSRGADSYSEYQRQLTKIVSAIVAINADVLGLMEIENDGYGADSSIAQLVAALNAEAGAGAYAYLDLTAQTNEAGTIGTDQIAVGVVYKPAVVQPKGEAKVLTSDNSPSDESGVLFVDTKNRPSVAQMFTHLETKQTFVFDVNHLKSKGSGCGTGDDDALQGSCNLTRTRAAQAVSEWLNTEFPGEPTVLVGDLNSYGQEDPILSLTGNGFVDAAAQVIGDSRYSYTFDGMVGTLDYMLLRNDTADWLLDVTEWHINADEPEALDYNEESKSADLLNELPFRASDHDPVIGSFSLPMLGDWDGDYDVDLSDVRGFMQAVVRRQTIDISYDLNGDGVVNMRDMPYLRQLCTNRGCL